MDKKELKILITGSTLIGNKGALAMFLSVQRILSNTLKDFNLTFSILTPYSSKNVKSIAKYNYKIYSYENLAKKFNIFSFIKNNFLAIKAYIDCDLVVDISGISYCDSDSFFSTTINRSLFIIPALLFRKPFINFTQSFGPIKKPLTKTIARIFLNKCSLTIPREKKSKECLEKIGVRNNMVVCIDSAFGMEAETPDFFKKEKLTIGICPSEVVNSRSEGYAVLVAKIIDFLIENLEAKIIIVPHYSKPSQDIKRTNIFNDDFSVASKIINISKHKKEILFLKQDFTPPELKGIIGSCDAFIGSRYHALIASISMSVPSIAIGWSYKYDEFFKMAGIEEYSLSFKDLDYETLKKKTLKLLKQRKLIEERLTRNHEKLLESSYKAGEIVKEFIVNHVRT